MARIRSIKPETWDDEVIGRCSALARLTFYGLISYADDEGRGRSGAQFLKSRLHAHAPDVSLQKMEAAIAELAKTKRVLFYSSDGEKYYWVRNFGKHQVIKKPSRSVLPTPPQFSTSSPPVENQRPTSSPPVGAGTEGNGGERSGEERSGARAERSGSEEAGSTSSATAPDAPPQEPEEKFTMASVAAELGVELPGPDVSRNGPPSPEEIRERNRRMKARLAESQGITVEELERRGAEIAARETTEPEIVTLNVEKGKP